MLFLHFLVDCFTFCFNKNLVEAVYVYSFFLVLNRKSKSLHAYKFFLQVCPQAADVVEVFIYLSEPCHVCQLLLTVSHGADDSTFPSTVDVRTGRYLDGLKLVVEVWYISF